MTSNAPLERDFVGNDGKTIKKSKYSIAIPFDDLERLKKLALIKQEPPASIIRRLMDEHDVKTMQKVVRKMVK